MTEQDHPKAVTIKEAVIVSGFSRATIYRLIDEGEFPGHKTSRGVSIPRRWFEDWQRGEWTPLPKPEPVAAPEPVELIRRRAS